MALKTRVPNLCQIITPFSSPILYLPLFKINKLKFRSVMLLVGYSAS